MWSLKKKLSKKSGFTLLEIIIVIIIVGVLASLALPRFFDTVEYSRSTEALANLNAIKNAYERCMMLQGVAATCENLDNLDISNPNNPTNRLFDYSFTSATDINSYTIVATRTTLFGASGTDTITFDVSAGELDKDGTTAFDQID